MAFQFMNLQTKQIYTLNEVDTIAAKFWGKEVHPKYYASPYEGHCSPNWFDTIGHAVEDLQYFKSVSGYYHRSLNGGTRAEFDMREVAALILNQVSRFDNSTEEIEETLKGLKPFLDLCYHLKSLDIIGVGKGW